MRPTEHVRVGTHVYGHKSQFISICNKEYRTVRKIIKYINDHYITRRCQFNSNFNSSHFFSMKNIDNEICNLFLKNN